MTISASGLYSLTFEKYFTNAAALNLEAASEVFAALILDTYTPAYDTHDFFADVVAAEVSGTGYSAGGSAVANPAVAAAQPAAGAIRFTHDDPTWPNSTLSSVQAVVDYHNAIADELIGLSKFATALNTVNGTLTADVPTNGFFNIDLTP